MKKSVKVLIVIASVLLLIAVFGCAAVSAFTYMNMSAMRDSMLKSAESIENANSKIDSVSDTVEELRSIYTAHEDVAQEDDVCIAGEYYIRSTTAISDAYKSGDTSALDDRQKETLKMASDILDEVIEDGMTPYEKEKAVYLWLTNKLKSETGMLTVIPTTNEDCDNPYGVLKYRSAVCVGYATTFRMFMQMMDIDCMVVHDTSVTHSWDLVTLDGERYHVDCYFDSDQESFRHFNLNDEAMGQDHDWNRSFFPKATGKKYNYAVQNAVELENVYEIPAALRERVDADESCFSFTFKSLPREEEPAAVYIVTRVTDIINMNYSDRNLDYYWSADDNGNYTLCFFCTIYNEDPVAELDDETAEKIENAIENAFGDMDTSGYYYGDPGDYSNVYYYTDDEGMGRVG